jgi:ubiquinone/menaquinone biosynthesis C-methylase UbiE
LTHTVKKQYNQPAERTLQSANRVIDAFPLGGNGSNIDAGVVSSFGEEWTKFNSFNATDIDKLQRDYFDILTPEIVNKTTYGIDIGCGTGRWTKCLLDRIGFMEAIDPSQAILAADKLLGTAENVRLTVAATDNIPFDDETFDFGMSIGVLHHIPDTRKALADCVKKIKRGGYFYVYLYYSLDNRGPVFRFIFFCSSLLRRAVSVLPSSLKKTVCDILAVALYMPFVIAGRLLKSAGMTKLATALPLSAYQATSFHIIRNDALDRFGTQLEHRFSKQEIIDMMLAAGLSEINVSPAVPYWHAIGKRVR